MTDAAGALNSCLKSCNTILELLSVAKANRVECDSLRGVIQGIYDFLEGLPTQALSLAGIKAVERIGQTIDNSQTFLVKVSTTGPLVSLLTAKTVRDELVRFKQELQAGFELLCKGENLMAVSRQHLRDLQDGFTDTVNVFTEKQKVANKLWHTAQQEMPESELQAELLRQLENVADVACLSPDKLAEELRELQRQALRGKGTSSSLGDGSLGPMTEAFLVAQVCAACRHKLPPEMTVIDTSMLEYMAPSGAVGSNKPLRQAPAPAASPVSSRCRCTLTSWAVVLIVLVVVGSGLGAGLGLYFGKHHNKPGSEGPAPTEGCPSPEKTSAHDLDASAPFPMGHDYCWLLFHNTKDQSSAEQACVELGGHLATVNSSNSTRALKQLLSGATSQAWIGLWSGGNQTMDREQYRWLSGAQLGTVEWGNSAGVPQPDNWNDGEGICVMWDGLMSTPGLCDKSCSYAIPFVCEFNN